MKKLLSVFLTSILLLGFFSCKKSAELESMQGLANKEVQRNMLPRANEPVIYFTRNYQNSSRAEFYSIANLAGTNPKVTLVAVGDKKYFPGQDESRLWTMNEVTQEIWQPSDENPPMTNMIKKFNIGEYLSPPLNSVQNAVKSQQFGIYGGEQVLLDHINNKVYNHEGNFSPLLWRTNMDGTNEEVAIQPQVGFMPTTLELDDKNGKLYFISGYDNYIRRIKTDGTQNTKLIDNAYAYSGNNMNSEIKIDVEHNRLYWIKTTSMGNINEVAIMRSDLNGNNPTKLWYTSYNSMRSLRFVIDKDNQQIFFIRAGMPVNGGYMDNVVRMDTNGKNLKTIFSVKYEQQPFYGELFELVISQPALVNN